MPLTIREPDAIDLWFAMQRKVWWKKWWLVLVPLAIIVVWHVFSFCVQPGLYWVYAYPPGLDSPSFLSADAHEAFMFWQRLHYFLHDGLIIPAVLVPLTLAGSLVFPNELIAAVGFNHLLMRKRLWIRKAIWWLFSALYFFPMAMAVLFPGFWSAEALPFHLIMICWLVIFLAISEVVVFVTSHQLENWMIVLSTITLVTVFVLFRIFLLARAQDFLASPIGIIDTNIVWLALKPIAIAALVSLVALVFLVRANKSSTAYMANR